MVKKLIEISNPNDGKGMEKFMKNNFEFAAFNLHKKHTNCWFLARKERIKYQFESIIVNSVVNCALMHY